MKEKVYKLGELFCGPGGIALGAKNANVYDSLTNTNYKIEHKWANDYHSETCETYQHNFPNHKTFSATGHQ